MLQLDFVCWVQAESMNELVGARTAAAADSAIAGVTGGIGSMVQKLRRSAFCSWQNLRCPPLTVTCLPFFMSGVSASQHNHLPFVCASPCLSLLSLPDPYAFS